MDITDVTALHGTLVGGNLGKQVSRRAPGSTLNPSPHQVLISFTDTAASLHIQLYQPCNSHVAHVLSCLSPLNQAASACNELLHTISLGLGRSKA